MRGSPERGFCSKDCTCLMLICPNRYCQRRSSHCSEVRLILSCLKTASSEAEVSTDGASTECRIVPVMKIVYVVEHRNVNELTIEFVVGTWGVTHDLDFCSAF